MVNQIQAICNVLHWLASSTLRPFTLYVTKLRSLIFHYIWYRMTNFIGPIADEKMFLYNFGIEFSHDN